MKFKLLEDQLASIHCWNRFFQNLINIFLFYFQLLTSWDSRNKIQHCGANHIVGLSVPQHLNCQNCPIFNYNYIKEFLELITIFVVYCHSKIPTIISPEAYRWEYPVKNLFLYKIFR